MEASRIEHVADLRLARNVARGSTQAWHEFVTRYSGLIFSIVRRYLLDFDEDDKRNAYVQILEHFYAFGLERYDGRAALSTWVMTLSRTRCLDMLRSRYGRRRQPVWLRRLSKKDREIYRLYYLNCESYSTVAEEFRRQGKTLSATEFTASLDRLEAHMDRRLRTRLAYDLQAKSIGALSGRLLELLDHLRVEQDEAAESQQPDYEIIQAQTRSLLERIEACVLELDGPEQQVVRLHFYDDLAASRIASELNLSGPRRVYTLIDRALSSLRGMLKASPADRSAAPRARAATGRQTLHRTEDCGD